MSTADDSPIKTAKQIRDGPQLEELKQLELNTHKPLPPLGVGG
jgi:hypothetical protein